MNCRKQRQGIENNFYILCTLNQGTKAHKTYGTQLRVSFWARAYVAPCDNLFSRPVQFWAFYVMLSHWHVTCWRDMAEALFVGDFQADWEQICVFSGFHFVCGPAHTRGLVPKSQGLVWSCVPTLRIICSPFYLEKRGTYTFSANKPWTQCYEYFN